MDVFCLACNEPWDSYHMRHDAWYDLYEAGMSEGQIKGAEMVGTLTPTLRKKFEDVGWKFGASIMIIEHCPCCPDDAVVDKDKPALANVVAELLGDDTDGLQAELEDARL